MSDRLYKVTGPNGEAFHGGTGRWALPTAAGPGDWQPAIPNVTPCQSGYHLVSIDQLPGWLGPRIWVAEFHPDATVIDHGDKLVGSQARLVEATGWDDRTARLFAADCAEHVLHLFEDRYPDDGRPRAAVVAVRRFADGEIDRAALDAGWAAAWDAALDAARDDAAGAAARADAARAAGWDAAWDAEQRWQTERLAYYLHPEERDQ